MTDAKAPERIWAVNFVEVQHDLDAAGKYWNNHVNCGKEYIRKDLYGAIAKERDELKAKVERLTSGSVCEIAATNANVMSYVQHWEGRAEKAEVEVERLREALRDIYNSGQTDEPDHWRFRVLARDTARAALQRKEGDE